MSVCMLRVDAERVEVRAYALGDGCESQQCEGEEAQEAHVGVWRERRRTTKTIWGEKLQGRVRWNWPVSLFALVPVE